MIERVLLFGVLALLLVPSALFWLGSRAAPAACEDVYPREPDIGFYMAAAGPGGALRWTKFCAGGAKPALTCGPGTLLIAHGASPGVVSNHERRFHEEPSLVTDLAPWLRAGWNVGVFEWPQFADEPLAHFETAEAKIRTPTYYWRMQFTYRTPTGGVAVGEYSTRRSVARIFSDDYAALLNGTACGEVRLAGHSLGAQLALHAAALIHDDSHAGVPLPARVALLDPVYSPFRHAYLAAGACGDTVPDEITCEIGALAAEGVAVEILRTSRLNQCVRAVNPTTLAMTPAVLTHALLTEWGAVRDGACYSDHLWGDPANFPENASALARQLAHQHRAAVPYYLRSLTRPPHRCVPLPPGADKPRACNGMATPAPSAGLGTHQLLAAMNATGARGARLCFRQFDSGDRAPGAPTNNADPGDDLYYVTPCERVNL